MSDTKARLKIPFFTSGDAGGIAYMVTNNIINYIILIGALQSMGWGDDLIFGRVIPGLSIGLMSGGIYYAYMAHKLAKKLGHGHVTALPSGISTPAMFVTLYGVISPLSYSLSPEEAWAAAVAACFIGGFIEFCGGFVGPWIKNNLPRAALLGTVAGIGFIWMATQGVFDVLGDPIIGLPILIVAVLGLFGGYLFPKKVTPFIVAIVGGIVYAFALGRTTFDFSQVGLYFPNPGTTVQALINGFVHVAPFLTVVIPVEIYNFIETMDNVESANAAGDPYSVREAQFADGIFTMISAIFGGIVPNTVWLGHPGLKKTNAGASYSWISGVILGVSGLFGLFALLSHIIPAAVVAVTFIWCSVIMVAQAFKEVKVKHYAAVAIAMVPSVADYLYTQVTGAVGAVGGIWAETLSTGLSGYNAEVTESLLVNGVMWNGVPATKAGAILIGILIASIFTFIIDRKLMKAGIVSLAATILALFGFIHNAQLGVYLTSPFVIGWGIVTILLFIFHSGRNSWFKAEDDFEYV
ncbi:MAG TPA: xanthine/uracil/vitamin C permease [Clostridiaceae bacterium]|nr:xanthine/uracil/vitamin C permease [Clostridiaceae bacterium]